MQMLSSSNKKLIQSPLNYTGGKYRLLPQMLPYFPEDIDCFYDLFCGGCNVGINAEAKSVIYNDINKHLFHLFNTFKNSEKEEVFENIFKIIEEYKLSLVCNNGYDFYHCESANGLSKYNKEHYLKLREAFNRNAQKDSYYYAMLYVLIVYSFNNQIRFNSKGEFNLPVGKRDFNAKMQGKLSDFIDSIKAQNCRFTCRDFRKFDVNTFNKNDFIYADPPYLITCATYTENNGWNEKSEVDLLAFLDRLNHNGIRFALSNVLRSKGKENHILLDWISSNTNKYKVHNLNYDYSNSNYQTKDKITKSEEVLITNY